MFLYTMRLHLEGNPCNFFALSPAKQEALQENELHFLSFTKFIIADISDRIY